MLKSHHSVVSDNVRVVPRYVYPFALVLQRVWRVSAPAFAALRSSVCLFCQIYAESLQGGSDKAFSIPDHACSGWPTRPTSGHTNCACGAVSDFALLTRPYALQHTHRHLHSMS